MAKRRRKRQLGSSAVTHTTEATHASANIGYAIALMTNKARNGKCQAASHAYAEMMTAYGIYLASTKAGGKTSAPSHAALMRQAANEFNDRCLVNQENGLARRRRKARR